MQALAILLAVAVTSANSTSGAAAAAGLLRGKTGVSLPIRASRDSYPTRDRRSPSSATGIPSRAPINSKDEIQQVDFESDRLSNDPTAPPPEPAYAPLGNGRDRAGANGFPADPGASSRRDSLLESGRTSESNPGGSLAEGTHDDGRRRETAGGLTSVPGHESSVDRDPYAVPDLRRQKSASRLGEEIRRPLSAQEPRDPYQLPAKAPGSQGNPQATRPPAAVRTPREPTAALTPAVQREPLDPYSTHMVNDSSAPRRDDRVVPRDFDESPGIPPATGPRATAPDITTLPNHRFNTPDPRNPAANPGANPSTSAVVGDVRRRNLQISRTADSGPAPSAALPRQQVASVAASHQVAPATQAVPVRQPVAVAPPAAPGPAAVAYPQQLAVPVNPRVPYEERPWAPFFATLLALFASGGLNLYLGWIAWDTYSRYQELVADMRQETRQRERQRDRDRVRDKIMTTGAADYSF